MKAVITITMNPTVDKSSAVGHVAPERKLRCDVPTFEPGGGGINVSRAIAKLGGASFAYYPAGGPEGQSLTELLDAEGLNHGAIPIHARTRENLSIFEKNSQQQFRFGMPGPTLSREEWERCLTEIERHEPVPAYIVASGSLPRGVPEDFYGRVAKIAQERGARLVVDTSGSALQQAVATGGVYLIKPNLRELRELAGKDDEGEPEELAQSVIESGKASVVVVSMGKGGARYMTPDARERIETPTVTVKSKIGAGDSMVAGLVLALARGRGLGDAVRYGVAAGAAAVMTQGTELCTLQDTNRLYQRLQVPR
jgi:6-phosphofructokinase 2